MAKIKVAPGVIEYEISGLLPGQQIAVTATNVLGTGQAATYTAPAPSNVPDVPEVSD